MEWIQGAAASVMSAIGFEDIVQDTKKDDDKAQPASIAQTSASVATTPQGAMMTKEQLRRFFEAGAAMFAKTEVKLRLQQAHEAGEDVDDLISDMQKSLLEEQGVDGNWGISCLSRINTVYRSDPEFMAAFYQHVMREEAALDEAMLPEDMFRQKMDMMLQLQRQQDALKTRMQALPPDQRQRFMQTQQVLIAQMQQQHSAMGDKMLSMSQEERTAFIRQQMAGLETQLQKAALEVTGQADSGTSIMARSGIKGGKAS